MSRPTGIVVGVGAERGLGHPIVVSFGFGLRPGRQMTSPLHEREFLATRGGNRAAPVSANASRHGRRAFRAHPAGLSLGKLAQQAFYGALPQSWP